MRGSDAPRFSAIVKQARESQRWTQAYLAEQVEVDSNTVSRWERGMNVPRQRYVIEKLKELFEMTTKELGLLNEQLPLLLLYAQADEEQFVSHLKGDLQSHDFTVLTDEGGQRDAAARQEALRETFERVWAVVLLASPSARSSRPVKELLELVGMYRCRVYVLWVAGERWWEVLSTDQPVIDVFDMREDRYNSAVNDLVTALRALPTQVFADDPLRQEPTFDPQNPYKGLQAFGGEDERYFFGRNQLIEQLTDKIEEMLAQEQKGNETARLLPVIGPSGSGKSSVVMAGLLPHLKRGDLSGSEQWVYLQPIVPGAHPVEALTRTLGYHLTERGLTTIRADLEDERGRGLHELAMQLTEGRKTNVVLVIDQFEELFTQTIDLEERKQFLHLLLTGSNEPGGPVLIILTMRADFDDRPMDYPELRTVFEKHRIVVFPMSTRELRDVIEKPAALPEVQLIFDEHLVGDLLLEVQGQSGALPLLQFTLDQLFLQRNGHRLTRQAYETIGGVKGALATYAEKVYADLTSDEHRMLARSLFLRLIDPGVTEQDTTRRRAAMTELTLNNERETRAMYEVATTFLVKRLLTSDEHPDAPSTIEVSHEALIREWARLSTWLREAREDIALQQTISRDAAVWGQQGRPEDRLYRGKQLAEAQEWAERNIPSKGELTFLQISTAVQEQRQAEERVQQAQKLELERRVTRRQRSINVLTAVILVLIIVGLIGASLYQRRLLTAQSGLLTAQSKLLNSLPVNVTNLNDNGPGSLRDAIKHAHSGDVITFARNLGGTIRLTSGDIRIKTDVAVIGPGASVLAISGEHKSRVFTVNSNLNVAISNLTVKDGDVTHKSNVSFEASGGGIYTEVFSALTLTNVVITGNAADFGGGIYNHTGNLTITNSTISNNTAREDGGGIESKGTLTITNSTISNNTAVQNAGGIDNQAALFLTNSTISGNTATGDVATIGYGGGILNTGTANVIYTTLYGNKAVAGGGIANAIANQPANGIGVFLETSIVAGDTAASGPDILGAATLYYLSLIQNTSGANFSSGPIPQDFQGIFELGKHSLLGESPMLGPLQNNGGPTQTYALLPGSPAIDQMKPDASDQICGPNSLFPTDQRGVSRSSGIGCDLGAYEYMPS